MKAKILLIVILLIFIGAMFLVVPIFKNRYFEKSEKDVEQEEKNLEEEFREDFEDEIIDIDDLELDEIDEEAEKDLEEEEKSSEDEETIKDTYLDITQEDCDDKCEDYEDDGDDLKYCKEVCGFNLPREDVKEEECEEEEGLDQDYCLRDLAISKKDFNICDKIEDEKITESCKNRITEDIVDSQIKQD